jgi:hypothetical protein
MVSTHILGAPADQAWKEVFRLERWTTSSVEYYTPDLVEMVVKISIVCFGYTDDCYVELREEVATASSLNDH